MGLLSLLTSTALLRPFGLIPPSSHSPLNTTSSLLAQPTAPSLSPFSSTCLPGPFQHSLDATCVLPLDHPSNNAPPPWTRHPYCLTHHPYCIFTHTRYPFDSYGISIILSYNSTHPLIPKSSFYPALAAVEKILTLPPKSSSEYPLPKNFHAKPKYVVEQIPGRGLGVVAMEKIKRGEVIMVDVASLIVAEGMPGNVKRADGRSLLREAVQRLPEKIADKVLALARSSLRPEEVPVEEDVIKTNSFSVKVGGEKFIALFPEVARINHACKPSAMTLFDPTTLTKTVTATRDILPGEELYISYIDPSLPYTQRQSLLLSKWGFRCTCDLCTAPTNIIAESDARRAQIKMLGDQVLARIGVNDMVGAAKLHEELVEAVGLEGTAPHLGEHYEVQARLLASAGKKGEAKKWMKKAIDETRWFHGVEDSAEAVAELEGLMKRM